MYLSYNKNIYAYIITQWKKQLTIGHLVERENCFYIQHPSNREYDSLRIVLTSQKVAQSELYKSVPKLCQKKAHE